MLPKDKYTLFDKKEKSYRKSIHSTSSFSMTRATIHSPRSIQLTLSFQSCPSGLVSASVSTLLDSKRIFTPPHMYYTSKFRLWRGTCRSEKQHMDNRSFGFLELQRGHSEEDGGLQYSIITPALRSGFQFKCIRLYAPFFRYSGSPGTANNNITCQKRRDNECIAQEAVDMLCYLGWGHTVGCWASNG
jgi:hypothetical protein